MSDLVIEYRTAQELQAYAQNSRTHSDSQIDLICKSMDQFGFTNPILIDGEGEIIAGHGRLLAAEKLDLDRVPVIVLSDLSREQKRALVIADNQIATQAGWNADVLQAELQSLDEFDFDLSVLGFSESDLAAMLPAANGGLTDDNAAPALPEKPVTTDGDVWCLGSHRIVCGNASSEAVVKAACQGRTIDLLFTDPPYGVSYAGKNEFLNAQDKGNRVQTPIENDELSDEQLKTLWVDVFSTWRPHFSDYSSYYITTASGSGLLQLMMSAMQDAGMPYRHILIWNKNNHVLGRCDYNYKHEPILYGWSKKHKFFGGGGFTKSVWDIAKPLKNDLHPTMKPVELIENAIKNSSEKNQIVADMFAGSGSTIIACQKTGRVAACVEISPAYVDVIVKRWQDYTGEHALLDGTTTMFDEVEASRGLAA